MLTVHGNRVVGTSTGEGALTLAERWQADVILVAENLPGQSGLEVAKSLRARYPNTPVVLMAEERPDIQVAARLAGAAACLIKPFRFDALKALIDSMQLAPIPAE